LYRFPARVKSPAALTTPKSRGYDTGEIPERRTT
jgi:hypothetical protein